MTDKILILDDEAELADTCARLLQGLGFTCLVSIDSVKALELFDSERPSMVLSDIMLATGNGLEIARYVRQKSPNCQVILMTAYHTSSTEQQARDAGATGYIRKPFLNLELVSMVRELLARPYDHPSDQLSTRPKTC